MAAISADLISGMPANLNASRYFWINTGTKHPHTAGAPCFFSRTLFHCFQTILAEPKPLDALQNEIYTTAPHP